MIPIIDNLKVPRRQHTLVQIEPVKSVLGGAP